MIKPIILFLIITIYGVNTVYAADPIVGLLQNIPSSLLVYRYITITLCGAFFCILPLFLSWYFKYKREEQERYEKIYIILYNLCELLENSDVVGGINVKIDEIKTSIAEIHSFIIREPKNPELVKAPDIVNTMIGKDQPEPKSLNKYRKFD